MKLQTINEDFMSLVRELLDENNKCLGYVECKNEEALKYYIDLYNSTGFFRKISNTRVATKWEMIRRSIKNKNMYC